MTKQFQIVVYGASGFTGQYVAAEIASNYNTAGLTWALAGRSQEKLEDGYKPSIIIAENSDAESIAKLTASAVLLINCVGPFRYYGDLIVSSCIATKTHYVDINGETEFVERSFLKHNTSAEKNKVAIISTCGFDCVPNEMGNVFTKREFARKGYTPASVESFVSLLSGKNGLCLNYATYESAVQSLAHVDDLRALRKQVKTAGEFKLRINQLPMFEKRVGKYTVPFAGADVAVVKLGQKITENNNAAFYGDKYVPPVQFAAYLVVQGYLNLLGLIFFGLSLSLLSKFAYGRSLLLNNPRFFSCGVFSKTGPTEQDLKEASFSISFHGQGFTSVTEKHVKPDYRIVTRVTGYVSTPIMVVACAMTVLGERERVPSGVMTPAPAFMNTGLIERLEKRGIVFSVIEQGKIIAAKNQ